MHPILINYNSFVDHMFNCIFFDPCKQISRLVIIPQVVVFFLFFLNNIYPF